MVPEVGIRAVTAFGIARRELLARSIALPLLTSGIISSSSASAAADARVEPFIYHAPQSALDDLKRRHACKAGIEGPAGLANRRGDIHRRRGRVQRRTDPFRHH